MIRRNIFFGLTALPLVAIMSKVANAADKKTVRWKVPTDAKKVRVRAWTKDGQAIMDTNITVTPDQVFQIDVLD